MNRIKELRKARGITQDELTGILNVQRATLSKYETGFIPLTADTISILTEYFNVTSDYLLGHTKYPTKEKGHKVPVLGAIPAGIPIEAIEDILDYEEISADWLSGGREYFALMITGNSMAPKYQDKDIVIFQKAQAFDSGDECAVIVNGHDATFKKVIKQEYGIVLQPLNTTDYEPEFFNKRAIADMPVNIIGIARELRRKL